MKKVGLLLAVFVGLALVVYFYEIKGGEKREKAQQMDESLFRLEEDQVRRLEIVRYGKEPIVLEREDDEWLLKAPLETSVDRFVVDGLVRDITGARRERSFSDVEDIEQYQLHVPRVLLKVKSSDEEYELTMGGVDFTDTFIYVQFEGENEVHLSGKSLLASANKDVYEFRDKTIFEFEQDEIQAIDLVKTGLSIKLRRDSDGWALEEPLVDKADSGAVSSLLSGIKFARVEEFLEEESGDLKPYGLDEPSHVLRLRLEGSDQWTTLELGGKTDNGYYARTSMRPTVFTVKDSVADNIGKPAWEYRDKRVVSLTQDEVKRVRIQSGDRQIVVSRTDSDWLIEEPQEYQGQKTATYKFWYLIGDVVFELIDETVSRQGSPGVGETGVSVALTDMDGNVSHFDFGGGGQSFRARRRESGRQGQISQDAFEKLRDLKVEELPIE